MARIDLNEVRNGGPAACDNLCMALSKIPCPHVVAAAGAANVDMVSIICPELTTAHWKVQYEGTAFPLPSEAQIEVHTDLINKSICLPPALERPKSMKRKKGHMEMHGKKRSCSKCHTCRATARKCAPACQARQRPPREVAKYGRTSGHHGRAATLRSAARITDLRESNELE